MVSYETGDLTLRAEYVDSIVKNFALKDFKMLGICNIQATKASKNTYFEETDADLVKTATTGITGTSLGEVARGAAFPNVTPSFTEINEYLSKHAASATILWEDTITDRIPISMRTLLRVSRAVANSMDKVIITELNTTTNTGAASNTWDNAVISLRDPVKDILTGIAGMSIDNWDVLVNEGFIVIHPTNKMELLSNQGVVNAGMFYTSAVTKEGTIEKICGLRIIETTSQTENTVTMGISKIAMTWFQACPLTTDTKVNAGVDYTVKAWAYGTPALINNNAAWKITGC